MDSVALFSWIGWLRHHGIFTKILKKELKAMRVSKYALYTNIDTVDWNKKEKVEEWRSSWAEHANRYLENWKPISFFIT